MSEIPLVFRVVLACVFATAGVAKLLDRPGTGQSMREFGVPSVLSAPLAVGLPVFELVCAAALLTGWAGWWGATLALSLLTVFTLAIVLNLARGRTPDCHCFGRIHSEPVGWTTVGRNAVLGGLAAFVIAQGPGNTGPGLWAWLASLSRTEGMILGLFVTLLVLIVGGAVMLTQLLAQHGRMLLRLETIEKKLGGREALNDQEETGLPLNSPAPDFTASNLNRVAVSLKMLRQAGQPVVLVFTEPGCRACEQLAPDLARWQAEHSGRLTIVPVSRGDFDGNRLESESHGLQNVVLQMDREIAERYGVQATPSAVLIKDGLVWSKLAVGGDAIRDLVFVNTLPPPVKPQELVPPLEVRDLEGKLVNLTTLRGRRSVLLFWNPSCGFCKAMLNDLRSWERTRPRQAPDLVVMSTGTVEANRTQQLRSRVLLDQSFGVGKVFGVGGTPSAVVLDQEGRLASGVGIGSESVFSFLRAETDQRTASA